MCLEHFYYYSLRFPWVQKLAIQLREERYGREGRKGKKLQDGEGKREWGERKNKVGSEDRQFKVSGAKKTKSF